MGTVRDCKTEIRSTGLLLDDTLRMIFDLTQFADINGIRYYLTKDYPETHHLD